MQAMVMFITNFLLLVLSTSVSLCLLSEAQIYIEPTEGKRCPQNASCPNITAFGEMADSFSNSSNIIVYFLEGTHLLDLPELVMFRNLNNAVFVGKPDGNVKMEQGFHETVWQSTVVIKCTTSGGLAFVNSSNVTFKSITITNCGAKALDLNQTVPDGEHICNATLLFFRVASITIDHASVQNGSGYGLLVATDGFEITITSSSFAQNSASCESSCTGGNVILFYINPPPGSEISQTHKTLITGTNVSLGIGGEHANCFIHPVVGGLAIYMEHTKYEMDVFIDHVIAFGTIGGSNIEIFTTPHVLPYSLTINNTVCSHAQPLVGGGLYFYSGWQFQTDLLSNYTGLNSKIVILNSKFNENRVNSSGGGLLFYLKAGGYSLTVSIESTEINNNIADYGSGLYLAQNVFNIFETQWKITLSNVTINNNTNTQLFRRYKSAIFATSVTFLKLNNVRITNNNSTGLLAVNTKVLVGNNSESLFSNNSGVNGGGLIIFAESYLMLEADAHLVFINNHAAKKGGAIFVDTRYFRYCFFQYIDPNLLPSARIYFSSNMAGEAGSVLYGGNIDRCIMSPKFANGSGQIFNITFNYSDQTGTSVISSYPSQVCFCQNNVPNCSIETLNKAAYPGEEIMVQVVTTGQRNGIVPATIQLQGTYNTPALSSQPYSTDALQCKNISINAKHTGNRYLINSIVLPAFDKKLLNVTVLECLPGFSVSNSTGTCDCVELFKYQSLSITCNSTTQRISRKGDHWIGLDSTNECTVVVKHCPFDYCKSSEVGFTLNDSDPQCALNRTGTLCGSCQKGFSLSLGTNNCIQCPDSSHIALILPIAAAGFGLVLLLMVLNLTVSAGTINGLIFYANIVKVSENIFFPHGPIPVLSQFISWLNLDLGIETCFFSGMTAYAKVWLQFVFPLFIWAIIAAIIVLCRYSTWLTNKTGDNVMQVLATLILLSYTKLFRAIIFALKWTDLTCISGGQTRKVWSMDGNVEFLKSWKDVILFVVALLFLLLAVPCTFALLLNVLIDKYVTKIRFFRKWWVKFKPLCDAYNGPYKDSCRFWTGMLLLARIIFVFVASFNGNPQVATSTISVFLLSLMVLFGGIYRKKHLDILECWSLLNLAVLPSLLTSQLESTGVNISVSLMLITFIGILLYHMFLRFQNVKYFRKAIKFYNSIKPSKKLPKEEIVDSKKQNLTETSTAIEVCMLREPLLNEI